MRPGASGQRIRMMAKTNLYDYEPASMARKKILPVLEDTMIHLESLDMCQRCENSDHFSERRKYVCGGVGGWGGLRGGVSGCGCVKGRILLMCQW